MSDIFIHLGAKERVTNKLDTVQSLALRSLHVTEPWLLLTGDVSSSQRKQSRSSWGWLQYEWTFVSISGQFSCNMQQKMHHL